MAAGWKRLTLSFDCRKIRLRIFIDEVIQGNGRIF